MEHDWFFSQMSMTEPFEERKVNFRAKYSPLILKELKWGKRSFQYL